MIIQMADADFVDLILKPWKAITVLAVPRRLLPIAVRNGNARLITIVAIRKA
jgi:hypothetical protein